MMNLELYKEVVLTRDLPQHNLKAGDVATLVDFVPHPSGDENGCVLEIFNAYGESIAVVTVPLSAIKPLEEGRNSHNSFFGMSQDWIVQKLDVKNQCQAILWLP